LVMGLAVVIYLVGLAAVLSLGRITESAPQPDYLGSKV
jgi:hypothetical protein